jgi:PPOX class probable F420-dependent enzyme
MTARIPESHRDILDTKALAHLATIMPDGSPQVTPVWFEFDGTHVIVNSAKGRRKDRNMRADARVALSMCDPENPYRYLEIRGRVVEITTEGADAGIDHLAKRYLDLDAYPHRNENEVRVIYKIAPEKFSSMG